MSSAAALGVGIIRSIVIMPVEGKLGAMISASHSCGSWTGCSRHPPWTEAWVRHGVHDIGTESYEFCRGSSCRSVGSALYVSDNCNMENGSQTPGQTMRGLCSGVDAASGSVVTPIAK